MSTTLPPLPDHPEPRIMTWSELERQAIKAYGEECARAIEAELDSLRAVNAELLEALEEARRWIGDGDMGDGMAREIWTPKYTAAIDMVDAAIASARKLKGKEA